MSLVKRFCLVALLLQFSAAQLGALETDQYLVWGHQLEDSTDRLNEYMNGEIDAALKRVNRWYLDEVTCEDLPGRIFSHLFPSLISSKFRRFMLTDPEIDRFPEDDVGYFEYLQESIFRRPAFPYFMPLGRTIRVNGVNLGVDKLAGHLLGFGRRYYSRYLDGRREGLSDKEAVRQAVIWGLRVEKVFVGGMIDGIFSHSDLEANYRGMLLARSFCHGESPRLELTAGGWVMVRPVDLRDYVGPKLDESYYNNHYTSWRWRRVKPVVVEEYCPLFGTAEVQKQIERYRRAERPSLSQQVVEEHFAARGRNPQHEQSLEAICPPTELITTSGAQDSDRISATASASSSPER